jgi:hypothetical protein
MTLRVTAIQQDVSRFLGPDARTQSNGEETLDPLPRDVAMLLLASPPFGEAGLGLWI